MLRRSRSSRTQLIDGLPWAAAFALGAIVAPDRPARGDGDRPPPRRPAADRHRARGRERCSTTARRSSPTRSRSARSAGAFSLARRRAGSSCSDGGGRHRDRPRRRLGDRRDPPAARRPADRDHDLAAVAATRPTCRPSGSACSGVLAAVTVGIYVGWRAPEISSAPPAAARATRMWEILQFLLNALLFVLIGLQLPTILDGARRAAAGDADRLGGGGQRRGDRHAADLVAHDRCS